MSGFGLKGKDVIGGEGVGFEIVTDEAQLTSVRAAVAGIKNGVPRVLTRSLNKIGARKRSEIVKSAAKGIGVRQKDIRNPYTQLKRASFRNLECVVRARGRYIPLKNLNPVQEAHGVSYDNPDGGGRTFLASAFIVQTLGRHVYKRAGIKRLPIRKQLTKEPVFEAVVRQAIEDAGNTAAVDLKREIDVQTEVLVNQQMATAKKKS